MNVIAYSPWASRERFHREMHRLFNGLARTSPPDTGATWVPAVDILEQDGAFLLSMDIPGVDPAKVEVQVEKGVLHIKGERKQETTVESGTVRNRERVQGAFKRSFTLPEGIDTDNIQAAGKLGVLTITIPRLPVAQPRRITVNA